MQQHNPQKHSIMIKGNILLEISKNLKEANEALLNKNFFNIMKVRETLEKNQNLTEIRELFGNFWSSGEISILAGDTGVGKSVLAVQIADAITHRTSSFLNETITHHARVLYFDFELTDKQFSKRYKDHAFSDSLYRVTINPLYFGDVEFNFSYIREVIDETNIRIIILDNITALTMNNLEDSKCANLVMAELKKLSLTGISILVLGHIPKVKKNIPITVDHLAGSKRLAYFADNVFFLCRSSEGMDFRYIKQVKCRNAKERENIILVKIIDNKGPAFDFVRHDTERNHLAIDTIDNEMVEMILELKKEGNSLRDIAETTGISKSSVHRILKDPDKYRTNE